MLQDTIYDRTNNYKLQNSFYNKFQFLDFNCKKRNLTRHSGSSHICRSNLRLILHMLEIIKKNLFPNKVLYVILGCKKWSIYNEITTLILQITKDTIIDTNILLAMSKGGQLLGLLIQKKKKKHAFFSVNDSGRNKTDEEAYKVPSYKSCLVSSALNNPQMEYMW